MTTRLAAVVLAIASAAALQAREPDAQAVLTRQLRFSPSELAALRRGEIVKHGLPSSVQGEIAVAGGVAVRATKTAFFARVRDITRFKSGPEVLQIGRFSNPPVPGDLAALRVDRDDFDVRSCRVHDCGVRLSAAAIERNAREVGSNSSDAQARGVALFKQMLFDKVSAYASGSADPMSQYDDGAKPIRPHDELEGILASMPELAALVPGLPDHLRHYPASRVEGAEDFLYWSKEKFGLAPFITVTHVTIVCRSTATCVMATRDVYSSRYLDASVALAIATDVEGDAGAFDLIYDNRSRANALKGTLGGLRRALAERRARGGLEESLKAIKMQLAKE
jgi:hypothetical protein